MSVDTTQKIKFNKIKYNKRKQSNTFKYFNAYPVMLKNIDTTDIQIGYGFYIPLKLEAKNKKNEWVEIEHYYVMDCGTCSNTIFFEPNEILITTAVIYDGDYTTKLRLKIGESYSNEYFGTINQSQLKNQN